MDKNPPLEQRHHSTKEILFLMPMNDNHISHLIKLAQDARLIDLMGWNPFFEVDEIDSAKK